MSIFSILFLIPILYFIQYIFMMIQRVFEQLTQHQQPTHHHGKPTHPTHPTHPTQPHPTPPQPHPGPAQPVVRIDKVLIHHHWAGTYYDMVDAYVTVNGKRYRIMILVDPISHHHYGVTWQPNPPYGPNYIGNYPPWLTEGLIQKIINIAYRL